MQTEDDAVEILRQYCYAALVEKTSGVSAKGYQSLLDKIKHLKHALKTEGGQPICDLNSISAFVVLVKGLTQCVSSIHERKHEQLVKELLDVQIWRMHKSMREAILEFITHITVANGALVHSCLQCLVYSLVPPPGPPVPDPNPGQSWKPTPEEAAIQAQVVEALEKVMLLVPTAGSRVLPLLLGSIPHKLRDRGTQCLYLSALFSLAECHSGGPIREGLLLGVVDHLTNIDVEIRWEEIVDEQTEEAREEEGGLPPADEEEPDIFELEGMSELDLATGGLPREPGGGARGGWEGSMALKPANKEAPEGRRPAVNETADKLDSLMELTLQHIQRRVAGGQLAAAWHTLAAVFEKTVLQTHRSKFVQFLLFYTCRQAPDSCSRSFLGLLISRLCDTHQPHITRSASAAYIASFLARAAFVPEALVVECLQRLTEWCVRYTRDEDRRGGLPPIPSNASLPSLSDDAAARHAAFYATCQAVLYVLCYHMEPLLRHRSAAQHSQHDHHHHHHQQGAGSAGLGPSGGEGREGEGGGAPPPSRAGTPWPQAGEGEAPLHSAAAAAAAGPGGSRSSTGAAGLPPLPPGALSLAPAPQAQPGSNHGHAPHHGQRDACAMTVRALVLSAMPHLVTHPLDPLSSCAKSVVAEFTRQVKSLGLSEVYKSIKEWERRQADPSTATHRTRALEMFFPFDPYLLRRSASLLDLGSTYVVWRRGHPAGAVRADLESSDSESDSEDSEMSEGEKVGVGSDGESSGLSSSSSSEDESGDESSDDDSDDLRRTRFGSMPDSYPSSGGSGRGRLFRHHRPHLPGALKASLAHGGVGSGSPTMGFVLPGGGSYSTDGMASPYGTSPYGPYGTSFGVAPMSCTPNQ